MTKQTATPTATITVEVTLPATKHCAAHAKYFTEESDMRPISDFYGKTHGSSYCKKCQKILHTDRRFNDKALRAEFKEWKANRATA